jgi:hypothetical protein
MRWRTCSVAAKTRFSASQPALLPRLEYQLNYTWSRTFDNVSAINNVPTGSLTLQNNHCLSCDYGPASFDHPSRFIASGSYELPVGKGRKLSLGPANWVLGGWDFSGIYTVASGMPGTLFSGFPRLWGRWRTRRPAPSESSRKSEGTSLRRAGSDGLPASLVQEQYLSLVQSCRLSGRAWKPVWRCRPQ